MEEVNIVLFLLVENPRLPSVGTPLHHTARQTVNQALVFKADFRRPAGTRACHLTAFSLFVLVSPQRRIFASIQELIYKRMLIRLAYNDRSSSILKLPCHWVFNV